MSNSHLTKRAFVRGMNAELMRQGETAYPTKEAADRAADYVAVNYCPDPATNPEAITLEKAAELAVALRQASDHLCKEAGDRYQPSLNKTAAAADPEQLAIQESWGLLEKVAEETGSLYEGGDEANDMPDAAAHNAEAALEKKRRPENYANVGEDGVGNREQMGGGAVGDESDHPEKPKATDGGSNSATETSKSASLADIIRKVAASDTGSLMDPGEEQNDLPAAAANNAEAAQEKKRRGENYANKGEKGVGKTDMNVPGGATVGVEKKHPEAPKATDGGSNSVTKMSKAAAFQHLFEKCASSVVPYLPADMDDETKVAHVRAVMGLDTEKTAHYLGALWNELNPGVASSVAEHYLKTAEEDEDDDDEDDEEDPHAAALARKGDDDEESDDKEEKMPAFLMKEKKEAAATPSSKLKDLSNSLKRLNK